MSKNLLKSSLLVSLMTVTSRITGFLRDLVFAHFLGTAGGFDAFLIAYRIPNFLRRLFAEGAFSQAFIPVLAEYRQNANEQETKLFLDHMAGAMITVLFAVTILAMLITPVFIWLFAPGFLQDASRYTLATSMLRITFPYIMFISLTAFISGILNSYGKFGIPAFTPNLLNFALIFAAIVMAPWFAEPAKALAWGVLLGGLAQLGFQLPFLHKLHLLPKPQLLWHDTGVKKVLCLMLPGIFGVSVAQIGFFLDTVFASFLPQGTLSWLYYAERLTSFPLGVFGLAIATVVLPHLARKFNDKSHAEFSQALDWGLKFVLLIALPATLGLVVLAKPILVTLFHYGKFVIKDILETERALLGFACGIPGFMLIKVLASGFYARQDIKTPVRIAMLATSVNIVCNALLMSSYKHTGLALATSVASSVNAGLLFWSLYRKQYYQPGVGWKKFLLRLLGANALMALVLIVTTAKFASWLPWSWFTRAWHLGLSCGLALTVYIITLWLLGIKWRDFLLTD